MTRSDDVPKKSDGSVATSDELALLPSKVTSAALTLHPTGAVRPAAAARGLGSDMSDEDLVVAIQRGEKEVGKILYSRLSRVIDATLSRVIGQGQSDHDDLVQACFEEVVRTLYKGQFKGRCRLTSWAASIACHIGLNAIRSRKTERGIFDRAENVEDSGLRHEARGPEQALEARAQLRQLRAALATLSPGRAEAVLLHDALGYDLAEVAALTSSSEAAVQSRLVRGRRDLQERLALAGRGKVPT